MPKKKAKASSKLNLVKKEKNNKIWILVAIVIIALAAILIAQQSPTPSANNGGAIPSGQNQGPQPTPIASAGDVCRQNSECFIMSCRNTPTILNCINATHEELFYKDCGSINNVVPATQNFNECACIQRTCTVLNK
jgi:hypothetical protein